MYRKIVVCIDDSPLSDRVARVGADLACRYEAEVVLLGVFDPARFADQAYTGLEAVQMLDRHSRSLSNAAHRLSVMLHDMGVENRLVILPGRSVETILQIADREEADLIVLGSERRGRLSAWLNADLWSDVAHKASCNVLRVTPADWAANRRGGNVAERQPAGAGGLVAAATSAL